MAMRPTLIRLHWPLGLLALIAASSVFWSFGGGWLSRLALGWDAGVAVFLIGTLVLVVRNNVPEGIRTRAAALDEAGPAILPLALIAAAASVIGVVGEAARAHGGSGAAPEAILALITVALSWLFVHVIFALHYAHAFYSAGEDGKDRGGLLFPGDDAPDYWDFLHFALIIGVASQTADVQIADKGLRQLSTVHSVTAFVFNTVILALAINLAVGMLG